MSDDDVAGAVAAVARGDADEIALGTPTRRVGTPIRADSPSRRDREGSYRGETGGGTGGRQESIAAEADQAPKTFSSDVKTQNRWVESVTDTVVERVEGFNPTRTRRWTTWRL